MKLPKKSYTAEFKEQAVAQVNDGLKNERVHGTRYATRAEATSDIFDYVEMFYNRKPQHLTRERSLLSLRLTASPQADQSPHHGISFHASIGGGDRHREFFIERATPLLSSPACGPSVDSGSQEYFG